MNQGTAPDSAMWSLRSRGPAHTARHSCLTAQRAAPPRGLLARVFGVDPLHPGAAAAYRVALGELRVGALLDDLGPDWNVLHAVPNGDSDIDHLVVGPAGVFAVTTLNHAGQRIAVDGDTLYVDGHRMPVPLVAAAEAQAAARLLSRASGLPITVTPVVAVVDPQNLRRGDAPGVDVVPARYLAGALRARPAVLDPDVVASIARAAEEWTTWRPLAADLVTHHDPALEFAALRREVDRARDRRIMWSGAVVAAVAVTAFGAAASGLFA